MIMPRLVNPWRGAGAIHFFQTSSIPTRQGCFFCCFPYQPHQVYGPLYGHVVMSDFGLVPGEFGAGTDGCLYEHHAANVVDTSQSGDQAPRRSPSDTRKVWEDGEIPNSAASDRKQNQRLMLRIDTFDGEYTGEPVEYHQYPSTVSPTLVASASERNDWKIDSIQRLIIERLVGGNCFSSTSCISTTGHAAF